MKKTTNKAAVLVICLVAVIVGVFAFISNMNRAEKEEELTAIQKTLVRDMAIDYPPTPKEVVRYYNDIMKCLYNEDCTEEEIELLGNRTRELFDTDLVANNELGTYLSRLKADVAEFKDNKCKITNSSVAASTNVDLFKEDGFEFARLKSNYISVESGKSNSYAIVYLLRKDDGKRWRIYGWKDADLVKVNSQ